MKRLALKGLFRRCTEGARGGRVGSEAGPPPCPGLSRPVPSKVSPVGSGSSSFLDCKVCEPEERWSGGSLSRSQVYGPNVCGGPMTFFCSLSPSLPAFTSYRTIEHIH
uniref:Uncharacterized protein n=1 Tax=Physcomitrium patens TaxID=3218 RepID=A0A2K1K3D9_PHYPA|nr:hypothetical protein PHYPA_012766 [Physcomitrium patens]